MNLLALDTSTEAMSVAVQRGMGPHAQVLQHRAVGGAQASRTLIDTVLGLLHQADLALPALDAICFGAGPGAFTGLRTACAVAQGLAFGANVPVLPVPSLLALAEAARLQALAAAAEGRVVAILDARMDEVYCATYAFAGPDWRAEGEVVLCRPEALGWSGRAPTAFAGNAFGVYGARLALPPGVPCIEAAPAAEAMLRLAPQLLAGGAAVDAAQALPLYVRDKVALTTAERLAQKAVPAGEARA